ncbi:MAG TPA: ISL3 family transposase [Verrucomicrobiales bacterium]|nr:ISL3 family transposase [Verrucomicrobiales bacterium]HRJ10844.1 ISL3 family transposase [Prosthecobacter sp.]HRK15697.1 ISL3 family transposase [Prosthecobacter sp.]
MSTLPSLNDHYSLLLGLDKHWEVERVDLQLAAKRVRIDLRHVRGAALSCPQCQNACVMFDHAPEREWRHLDTMQFETVLRARVPRCKCEDCGVKTIAVPWAGKHSPFTWLFEAFAIAVLQSAGSTSDACRLLRIGWESAQRIMERGVQRGLERRSVAGIKHAGMDEKSFKRGQSYITTLNDIDADNARVLEVVEGRTHQAAVTLLESIPAAQRSEVRAVALDMWDPFLKAVRQVLPEADIVHDKYHVTAHLNTAVDTVRKAEHTRLLAAGDDTLKGSKYQWLRTYCDGRSSEAVSFRKLHQLDLKTSRAWHYKEDFRHFWNYRLPDAALRFYEAWRKAVMRSRLEPLKKVVRMIDEHWREIFNYIRHRITNAVSEGLNSRIQAIKSAARGFRSYANYRVHILFHCGMLDLKPSIH